MGHLEFDIAHLLGTMVLVLSFGLLFQRRIFGVLRTFALQASLLAAAAAWQAFVQDAPHLYITAGIALVFKAIVIPVARATSVEAGYNQWIWGKSARRYREPYVSVGRTF